MINEQALKRDKRTLGMISQLIDYAKDERNAINKDRMIRKGEIVGEDSPMVTLNFRSTEEFRDKVNLSANKLLARLDEELEAEGHTKVEGRGQSHGRGFWANTLFELLINYLEDEKYPEEEFPHQADLNKFFEKVVIPYAKQRRLARDY